MASKSTSRKKSTSKRSSSKTAAATAPRSKFPVYKTEAEAEAAMAKNLNAYRQYQVERDKNRSDAGMEKHRPGYRTYKNAYTQLLGLRKKAGKGRRNQAAPKAASKSTTKSKSISKAKNASKAKSKSKAKSASASRAPRSSANHPGGPRRPSSGPSAGEGAAS